MDETNEDATETPQISAVGAFLKETREKAGKSIEDIATDTRIPLRHLKAIEASDYSGLPGKTYAMGFVRAFARSLGLDEVQMVARLREELGTDDYRPAQTYEAYEPVDPARVPPRKLAWTAGLIALLLVGAWGVWRSGVFTSSNDVTVADTELTPEADTGAPVGAATGTATAAAPAVDANAEVVIAAKGTVWFRIDDATGKRVHEAELKTGERYVVPAGSKGLTIRTSRPQAMDVSVAGRAVPQLGAADTLVKNVSLDPAELAKRIGAAPAAGTAGAAGATGAAGAGASGTTPAAGADLSD